MWLILEHRLALWFFGGAKKRASNGLNRSHWEHQSNHSISDKRAWDARNAVVFCWYSSNSSFVADPTMFGRVDTGRQRYLPKPTSVCWFFLIFDWYPKGSDPCRSMHSYQPRTSSSRSFPPPVRVSRADKINVNYIRRLVSLRM